ncbi:hypothetical protein E2R59_11055 [Kocuria rosea]|uniref:Uncharacterized protein n=1 Tax=Kocuria rosea TaxID=1275 RepID=A0A4R5YGJ4_KOCRO|nr:hypothetical protein E2R59_11055 [Kocuria rosea]
MPLSSCGAGEQLPASAPLTAEATDASPQAPVTAVPPVATSTAPDPEFLEVETSGYPAAWAQELERKLFDHWNVDSWEAASAGIGWAGLVTDVRANKVGELVFVFEGSKVDQGVEQAADHAVQEVMYTLGPTNESLTSVAVMDTLEGRLFEWCTRSVLTQ